MMYWYTPHLRQPIRAHVMEERQGLTALCGEHMSIYRQVDSDTQHGRDERCPDCIYRLQNWNLHRAREQGHVVRDDDTEGSIVTRMIVEGWMNKPHYNFGPKDRCPCLGIFPKFLGPDSIQVDWGWDGVVTKAPMAFCGYHYAGITCEACPQCVRCRRRMSHEHGHWICDPWRA